MEADHTLDAKKLTEELEKMTEVIISLYSGLKQSFSLKSKSSQLKAVSQNSKNWFHTSKLMKVEMTLWAEVSHA